MQKLQDMETGEEWHFEDNVDYSTLSGVPKTLTAQIVKKPTDSHEWIAGVWVLNQVKANAANNAEILAAIVELETKQTRAMRELLIDAANAYARQKLTELNLQIDVLRKGLK